jgi:hypothetical protein
MLTALAHAVVYPGEYTAAELVAMSGIPPADQRKEGGLSTLRWKRAGYIKPPGLHVLNFSDEDLGSLRAVIVQTVSAGWEGTASALARDLSSQGWATWRETGKPTSSFERAVAGLVADGIIGRGIVPTESGRAAVMADPDAAAVVQAEREQERLRAAHTARLRGRARAARRKALELLTTPPPTRRSYEDPGAVGLPQRTRWEPRRRTE